MKKENKVGTLPLNKFGLPDPISILPLPSHTYSEEFKKTYYENPFDSEGLTFEQRCKSELPNFFREFYFKLVGF